MSTNSQPIMGNLLMMSLSRKRRPINTGTLCTSERSLHNAATDVEAFMTLTLSGAIEGRRRIYRAGTAHPCPQPAVCD